MQRIWEIGVLPNWYHRLVVSMKPCKYETVLMVASMIAWMWKNIAQDVGHGSKRVQTTRNWMYASFHSFIRGLELTGQETCYSSSIRGIID